MLTIAGGIILGFLGLGVVVWLFGGPSTEERLQSRIAQMNAELEAGERRLRERHSGEK